MQRLEKALQRQREHAKGLVGDNELSKDSEVADLVVGERRDETRF